MCLENVYVKEGFRSLTPAASTSEEVQDAPVSEPIDDTREPTQESEIASVVEEVNYNHRYEGNQCRCNRR